MIAKVGSFLLFLALSLAGSATLNPDYEEPSVALTSFRALPSEGMVPVFEVGLRIINPNPQDLELVGIVYSIELDGREIVKGVLPDAKVGYEGSGSVTTSYGGEDHWLLAQAMDVLNDREKDILTQRRLSDETVTLEELSGQYDVSRERIRQIEVRAFEKLQKRMRELARNKGMLPAT